MISRTLILGLALAASGCSGGKTAGFLENTSWRLISIMGQGTGVLPKDSPTLAIKNSEATGFGGCNGYSMVLTVYGTVVTFGAVTRAERTCPMAGTQLETAYLRALAGTARGQINGDTLVLRDQFGGERARFIRVE